MEQIIIEGQLLAYCLRTADWQPGTQFFSRDADNIQVGTWYYDQGQKLGPHRHVPNERCIQLTQETLFVKQGRLRATIYAPDETPVATIELGAGDFLVTLTGGHGYEIMEDDTQVLEVKNGPFTGLNDRVVFEDNK